jgi:hypothetical protein
VPKPQPQASASLQSNQPIAVRVPFLPIDAWPKY